MEPQIIVGLIAATAAVVSAVISSRSAARATSRRDGVDLRQIEAGAFERARASYEAAMATDRASYEAAIGRLQGRVSELERLVSRWSRQMRAAGLVPVSVDEEEGVV